MDGGDNIHLATWESVSMMLQLVSDLHTRIVGGVLKRQATPKKLHSPSLVSNHADIITPLPFK